MSNDIVTVKNVSHRYDHQTVLKNINLSIHQGDFVGLVGPNGSGKTTLIKLILGLEKTQSGTIEVFGEPVHKFKNKGQISYVSQKSNSFSRGFPASVQEVVSMGINSAKLKSNNRLDQVRQALKEVNMEEMIDRNVGELSGGQQQRVFIARALVNQPDFLILDEPTVGVDHSNVEQFYDLLAKLNQELGITLLLVSHDIGSITTYVNDLLCLNQTVHYHGDPNDFEQMPDHVRSKWYGHDIHTITHEHDH